jgi:ABC-type dipeptide/oligopeptide/nickel transport system permease component
MYGGAIPIFVWIFLFKRFPGNSVVLMCTLAFCVVFGESVISYHTTCPKHIMPFFSDFILMYGSAFPNFVWIFLFKGFHGNSVGLMCMLACCVFFGKSVISYHTTCPKHTMLFFSDFIPMYGSALPNFI